MTTKTKNTEDILETLEQNNKPKKKGGIVKPVVLALALLAGGTYGFQKYTFAQHHEDTDDAQIEGEISPVLPRVAGYVNEIRFEDNQHVSKGDTLVKLDDRDLKIKVAQAEAALANAKANVSAVAASG